jgi:tRNA (mo5U34)-methyltransferase
VSLEHLGQFDYILYLGVFYHLIDPISALRDLAAIAKRGLILETHIETTAESRPMMVFYPGGELNGDPSNWWGPNEACVVSLLRHFGFLRIDAQVGSGESRLIVRALRSEPQR